MRKLYFILFVLSVFYVLIDDTVKDYKSMDLKLTSEYNSNATVEEISDGKIKISEVCDNEYVSQVGYGAIWISEDGNLTKTWFTDDMGADTQIGISIDCDADIVVSDNIIYDMGEEYHIMFGGSDMQLYIDENNMEKLDDSK